MCQPRIAEQCAGRTGRELRRCRRPLLRACRLATPDVACPTTTDLTSALGDRLLELSTDRTLRLCEDGRFVLTTGVTAQGRWSVVVSGDALAIELDGGQTERLRVERDAARGFLVDGTPAADVDATSDCASPADVATPEPDPERVLAVARALTDRTVRLVAADPSGGRSIELFELCSSGDVRVAARFPGARRRDRGTWSIDEAGTSIELSLEEGIVPPSIEVTVLDDGRVLFDGQETFVADAREQCDDLALEARLTALLQGSVYVTNAVQGSVRLTTTIAFCDAERFSRRSGIELPSTGDWVVRANAGVAVVHLIHDAAVDELPLTLTSDGIVLVDGNSPLENPEAALRNACQ